MYVDEKKVGEQQVEVDAVGRTLLEAANYIERHGWCQGTFSDREGRVCVVGSLYHALTKNLNEAKDAYWRLRRYLNSDLPAWNDALGRTQEEVMRALREAAYQGEK